MLRLLSYQGIESYGKPNLYLSDRIQDHRLRKPYTAWNRMYSW